MSGFDFTALLKFLGALVDAFMNLFAKLGFDFSGGDTEGTEDTDAPEAAE